MNEADYAYKKTLMAGFVRSDVWIKCLQPELSRYMRNVLECEDKDVATAAIKARVAYDITNIILSYDEREDKHGRREITI